MEARSAVVCILALLAGAAQTKHEQAGGDARGDLARENLKTQQILAQYLQRRLFPQYYLQQQLKATLEAVTSAAPNGEGAAKGNGAPAPPDVDDESLQTFESEQVAYFNDPDEDECSSANCLDEGGASLLPNRWTMPLLRLGEKRFYLGIFFKANWYRATQYCRYHGMHLASISSQEENDKLEKHIRDYGLGHEHFWTSGTDQAEEGTFFWMATGRPITFTNWNTGEPNNFRYENGEEEHCLELWNRDGKGLKWNDSPCSFETYFVCEV